MRHATLLTVCTLLFAGLPASAQAPTTQPAAAAAPTTQPVQIDEAFEATIIQIKGEVSYALAGPDGTPGKWQSAKAGDKLPAGTRIQTLPRSTVILAFGDDTVVLIDRITLANIDQFHRSGDTKRVKLGLGHGMIRAASVETTLRSDMEIEAPTATLSKRGTIDFGMRYNSGSRTWEIFLNREGLVEALNHLTNQRRTVNPGQYVTQAMVQWIQTATLDRYTPIIDTFGTTAIEQNFNARHGSGLGSVDPGAGAGSLMLTVRPPSAPVGTFVAPSIPTVGPSGGPLNRPEGNFGTGLGTSP